MSVPGGGKYTFPNLTDAPTALVCVPTPIIPFFRDFFAHMQQRGIWKTRDDWLEAYRVFGQIEADLMASCIQELIDSNNRLYRLLDTALNGTAYTSEPDGTGGSVVSPQIADVPPSIITDPESMRAQLRRLHQLTENAQTGAPYSAGEAMDATVELDYEGSWTARLMGLSAQLSRITSSIDGGGEFAPADNVLTALRGTDEASATRNVIDAQGTTTIADLVDQVEALLTEIRDKLV